MARKVTLKQASLAELSPEQMIGAQFKTRTTVEQYIETTDGLVIPICSKSGEVASKANLEQFSAVTNADELMAASDASTPTSSLTRYATLATPWPILQKR